MSERQSVSLTPGYLLHARPYRDSSVIAEFFTREHGRVALVVRGARRPKSKLKGQIRPFQRSLVSWVSRGSLGTLTALESAQQSAGRIPRNVLSAYYANELIIRALRPGDSQSDIFDRYETFLEDLEQQDEATVLRLFERDLLEALGYGLQLRHTRSGDSVKESAHYLFDVTEGPVEVEIGQDTLPGSSLLALCTGRLETRQSHADAKRLLRRALDLHLGVADSKVRRVLVAMQAHRREWREHGAGDTPEAGQ